MPATQTRKNKERFRAARAALIKKGEKLSERFDAEVFMVIVSPDRWYACRSRPNVQRGQPDVFRDYGDGHVPRLPALSPLQPPAAMIEADLTWVDNWTLEDEMTLDKLIQ